MTERKAPCLFVIVYFGKVIHLSMLDLLVWYQQQICAPSAAISYHGWPGRSARLRLYMLVVTMDLCCFVVVPVDSTLVFFMF